MMKLKKKQQQHPPPTTTNGVSDSEGDDSAGTEGDDDVDHEQSSVGHDDDDEEYDDDEYDDDEEVGEGEEEDDDSDYASDEDEDEGGQYEEDDDEDEGEEEEEEDDEARGEEEDAGGESVAQTKTTINEQQITKTATEQQQQKKQKKKGWTSMKQFFGKVKYQSIKSVSKTKLKIDVYKKRHGELNHYQQRLQKRMERFGRQYMQLTLSLQLDDEKNQIQTKQKQISADVATKEQKEEQGGDEEEQEEAEAEAVKLKNNHKHKMKCFRLIRQTIRDCQYLQRKIDTCQAQILQLELSQYEKLKSTKRHIYDQYQIMKKKNKNKKNTADENSSMDDQEKKMAAMSNKFEPSDPILRMDDDDKTEDEKDEHDGDDHSKSNDNDDNGPRRGDDASKNEISDNGDSEQQNNIENYDEYDDFDDDNWVNDNEDEDFDNKRASSGDNDEDGGGGDNNDNYYTGSGSNCNNKNWIIKEFHYNGKALYDTIGNIEKVKGESILDAYMTKFLPNPNKYVALCYQSNLLQLPSSFHSYTLVHRIGTVGFRPSSLKPDEDNGNEEEGDNDGKSNKHGNIVTVDSSPMDGMIDDEIMTAPSGEERNSFDDEEEEDENTNKKKKLGATTAAASAATSIAWLTMLRYDYAVIPPFPKRVERNILPYYARDIYTDTDSMRVFTNPKITQSITKYRLQTTLPGRGMGSAADYNGGFGLIVGGGKRRGKNGASAAPATTMTNNKTTTTTVTVSLWGMKGYPVPQHCIQSRYLSNCWLISGIASLAEYKNGAIIRHIFRKTPKRLFKGTLPPHTDGTPNYYVISLFDLTTWKEVDYEIDERLFLKYNDSYDLLGARPPIESKTTTNTTSHQDEDDNDNSNSYNDDFNESAVIGRTSMWNITKAIDSTNSARPTSSSSSAGIASTMTEINLPLWVCYLEKAVAIHCGGWDQINMRSAPTHAWSLLTGHLQNYQILLNYKTNKFKCIAPFDPDISLEDNVFISNSPKQDRVMNRVAWPTSNVKTKSSGGNDGGKNNIPELTKDQLFQRMCLWKERNNWIIAAGTKGESDENVTEEGIVDNHVYSILRCLKNVANTGVDMLYVRNPYGKGELTKGLFSDWTGSGADDKSTSDASSTGREEGGQGWTMYPQIRKELKPKSRDDGCFWITKDEFFQFFEAIFLCTWEDDGSIIRLEQDRQDVVSQISTGPTAAVSVQDDVVEQESSKVVNLRQQVQNLQKQLQEKEAVIESHKKDTRERKDEPVPPKEDSDSSWSSASDEAEESKKSKRFSLKKLENEVKLKELENELKLKDQQLEYQKNYISTKMKDAKDAIEAWKVECAMLQRKLDEKSTTTVSTTGNKGESGGIEESTDRSNQPTSNRSNASAEQRTTGPSRSGTSTPDSPKRPKSKTKIASSSKKPSSKKRNTPASPKRAPNTT